MSNLYVLRGPIYTTRILHLLGLWDSSFIPKAITDVFSSIFFTFYLQILSATIMPAGLGMHGWKILPHDLSTDHIWIFWTTLLNRSRMLPPALVLPILSTLKRLYYLGYSTGWGTKCFPHMLQEYCALSGSKTVPSSKLSHGTKQRKL